MLASYRAEVTPFCPTDLQPASPCSLIAYKKIQLGGCLMSESCGGMLRRSCLLMGRKRRRDETQKQRSSAPVPSTQADGHETYLTWQRLCFGLDPPENLG